MARIPDELIERVRDTADLLEIVQEAVQLKRQGSDYRGPCPFHNGTGRNFAPLESSLPRSNSPNKQLASLLFSFCSSTKGLSIAVVLP